MKIYNKGFFYGGILLAVLSVTAIGLRIGFGSFSIYNAVFNIMLLLTAILHIRDDLNKRLSLSDKIEQKDERNILIADKSRSLSFLFTQTFIDLAIFVLLTVELVCDSTVPIYMICALSAVYIFMSLSLYFSDKYFDKKL